MGDVTQRIAANQAEVAEMLGVSEAMVRKLDASGELPSAKIGACKRYLIDDVRALFRKRKEVGHGREAAHAG